MNVRIFIFLLLAGVSFTWIAAQEPVTNSPEDEGTSLFSQDENNLSFSEDSTAAAVTESGGIWATFRMVLILVLVVAVIYGVVFLLKRAKRTRFQSPMIRVVGTQSIGNNRLLYVVQLGEQVFFLAASEAGIHLISEITDKETRDFVQVQAEKTSPQPFSNLLTGVISSFNGSNGKSLSQQMEGLRSRSDRMGRL